MPRGNDTEGNGGAAENISDAVTETNQLNRVSQPLGYAVTCRAGGGSSADEPDHRRFTVHRIDHPVAHGPSFDTADDVHHYLDDLKKLPRWRLDLDDDSIDFDRVTLTVADKRTGESFCLRGWKSSGINGVVSGDERRGALAGHISVIAAKPPTIGRWYRANTRQTTA
jgi:hypothetical protein